MEQSSNHDEEKEVVKILKKRGRKPKVRTAEELLMLASKVKKKRGRRPKEKYNFNNKNIDEEYFNTNNKVDSVIVRMPINIEDMEKNEINIIPKPYDPIDSYNAISDTNENKENLSLTNEDILDDKRQISLLLKNKYVKDKNLNLLSQLSHCNKLKKWPVKTEINCFWCCHCFDNTPWGIPQKYEKEEFTLFGVFCSPNCAAAYLFDNDHIFYTKWEKYSLLNFLYYKVYDKIEEIMLAPSKLSLTKFGGCLTIEEYRDKNKLNDKIYELKFPPTISIIPVIEEMTDKKLEIKQKKKNFIPVDKTRIKKANQEFKLKRTKPINNNKNTLNNCMNITIN
jgi:hypothetical protein